MGILVGGLLDIRVLWGPLRPLDFANQNTKYSKQNIKYANYNTKCAIFFKRICQSKHHRAMKYVQKQEDDVGCTHTVTFLATALNICDQGHGGGGAWDRGLRREPSKKLGHCPSPNLSARWVQYWDL